MTGSFVKGSNTFRIREIKTVEVKSQSYSSTCIMNYDLRYSRSGKEEYLEGTYLGKPEVKEGENPYAWGACGGGKVFLRRVVASNFYVEPFLRKNTTNKPVTTPPVERNLSKPLTPPPVVKKESKPTTPARKPPVATTDPGKKTTVPPPVMKDSSVAIQKPEIKKQSPVVKAPVSIPDVLKNRETELMRSLLISNPTVTIKIFDNGEIDDDTVSVYLDKKLVLSNKRLTTNPLIVTLKMDEENPDHELVMVAENLGRIPPNTSLMIVEAGDQRFDVRITSTEQKNAMVRFKYQPPK